MKKFGTFTLDSIKFIDSFLFLRTSLATLVQNLNGNRYNFPIFNHFKDYKGRFFLKHKGIFPSAYFNSEDVWHENSLLHTHTHTQTANRL